MTRLAISCRRCSAPPSRSNWPSALPRHIASLVLLAPSVQPELCYVRLARRLMAARPDAPALPAALERYLADPRDRARFWQLVGAVVSIPAFSHVYWGPGAQAEAASFDTCLGNRACSISPPSRRSSTIMRRRRASRGDRHLQTRSDCG